MLVTKSFRLMPSGGLGNQRGSPNHHQASSHHGNDQHNIKTEPGSSPDGLHISPRDSNTPSSQQLRPPSVGHVNQQQHHHQRSPPGGHGGGGGGGGGGLSPHLNPNSAMIGHHNSDSSSPHDNGGAPTLKRMRMNNESSWNAS